MNCSGCFEITGGSIVEVTEDDGTNIFSLCMGKSFPKVRYFTLQFLRNEFLFLLGKVSFDLTNDCIMQ